MKQIDELAKIAIDRLDNDKNFTYILNQPIQTCTFVSTRYSHFSTAIDFRMLMSGTIGRLLEDLPNSSEYDPSSTDEDKEEAVVTAAVHYFLYIAMMFAFWDKFCTAFNKKYTVDGTHMWASSTRFSYTELAISFYKPGRQRGYTTPITIPLYELSIDTFEGDMYHDYSPKFIMDFCTLDISIGMYQSNASKHISIIPRNLTLQTIGEIIEDPDC